MRIAQASDNNCCARAISTMRLALGYREGLPATWEMGRKDGYELISSLGGCFPNRDIIVACPKEEIEKVTLIDRVHYVGEHITYGDSSDDIEVDEYLSAFVYATGVNSHIVVGTPGFREGEQPEGFKISLVFAVSLEETT